LSHSELGIAFIEYEARRQSSACFELIDDGLLAPELKAKHEVSTRLQYLSGADPNEQDSNYTSRLAGCWNIIRLTKIATIRAEPIKPYSKITSPKSDRLFRKPVQAGGQS
jgi:hypothetical protein